MRMKKLCGLLAALTLAACADDPDSADPTPTTASTLQAIGTAQQPIARMRTQGVKVEDDALAAVRARISDFGLSPAIDDFKTMSTERGIDGLDHVRLQQLHRGVPVWGADIVVHGSATELTGLGGNVAALQAVDTTPAIQPAFAVAVAKADYARRARPGSTLSFEREGQELVVLPLARTTASLAWLVTFRTEPQAGLEPGRWNYFIDAHTGALLKQYNGLTTAVSYANGPGGNARVSRTWTEASKALEVVSDSASGYKMETPKQSTRNVGKHSDGDQGGCSVKYLCAKPALDNEYYGDIFTSSTKSFSDAAGNDAHAFTLITLNFLQSWFGYTSISPTPGPSGGLSLLSRVHYGNNYDNANWNGEDARFGDGNGVTTYSYAGGLDVVAHEFAHGFTQYHSQLVYEHMSGAMNESFSDIAGISAKFYDSPTTATFNYGSDIQVSANTASRYLCNPTIDGSSIDNASSYSDSLEVHQTSGVMNKAFCRAARRLSGVNVDSGAATADGVHMAARAWFAANANYWSTSSTFQQGCQGVVDAALALGYNSTQAWLIGLSWEDVGVVCNYPQQAGGGVTGDFDGDGYADVMATYHYPNGTAALWVFPGTAASGNAAAPPYLAWSSGSSAFYAQDMLVAAGDFNGDGKADVIGLYDYGNGSAALYIFPGSATHTSVPYRAWHVTSGFNVKKAKLTAGKYNADNYADALVLYDNGSVSASLIMFPGASGTTQDAVTSPATVWTSPAGGLDATRAKITVADFNRDGKDDVVMLEDYSNVYGGILAGVWVFPSAPGASSPAPYQIWYGNVDVHHSQVAGGDFDGDGYRDLMVFTDLGASGQLQIFPSSTGTVSPYTTWTAAASDFKVGYTKITGGDFNQDGKDDLLQLYDYSAFVGPGAAGLFVTPGTASQVTNAVPGYRVWYTGPGGFEVGRAHVP